MPGTWRRSGEAWVVGLGDQRTSLRDSKGLRHLAHLLARPNDEIGALDLVAATEGHAAERSRPGVGEGLSAAGPGHAGDILDARAKAAYRERIEQAREELDEAERFNDPVRADRARMEIDFLARELSAALGLGGRSRKAGAESERARVNVTRSIKTAIERIEEHDQLLAAHLRASVRTGTFCAYAPPAVDRVAWSFVEGEEAPAVPAPPQRAPVPPPVAHGLLERDDELAAAASMLDAAAAGTGTTLVVNGPPGMGKTALLRAVETMAAERGMEVMHARGRELEQPFTFGLVRQLFDPPLAAMAGEQRAAALRGAVRPAAAMLGYSEDDEDAEELVTAGFPILNALYWLASVLAQRRPVLFVVDDAHWADEESVAWLSFMAGRLRELPIALALGARTGRAAPELSPEQLSMEGAVPLTLRPLSPGAVLAIIRRTWPDADEDFGAACHAASAGNPFFLAELVASARASALTPDAEGAARLRTITPESVGHAVIARLSVVPGDAAQLARACAVLGVADVRLAAAVAGIPQERALEAVDALTVAGILDGGHPLDYAHPLIRAAVERALPFSVATELRERAAHELTLRGAPAHEVAAHVLHARPGGRPDAVEHLREAARHALLHGSPASAAQFLERALDEPPSAEKLPQLLLELAQAREASGEITEAVAAIERALPLTRDPRMHASLVCELCRYDAYDLSERLRRLDAEIEAIAGVDRELRFELEAQALDLLAQAVVASASPDARARHFDRLERVAREADGDSPSERQLLAMYASLRADRGDIEAAEVKRMAVRALDDGVLMHRLATGEWSADAPLEVLLFVDAFDLADRHARDAERRARERGMVAAEGYACMLRAVIAVNRGALDDAEALLRSVFALSSGAQDGYALYVARQVEACVAIERGDLDAAEAACAALADSGYAPMAAPHARGRLLAARGEHDLAVAELRAAYDLQRSSGRWRSLVLGAPAVDLSISLAATGRRAEADHLAGEHLGHVRRLGAASAVGEALRAQGLARAGADRLEPLEEAAGVVATSQALLVRARVLHALGGGRLAGGDAAEASRHLGAALALARHCGAQRLAEAIAAELSLVDGVPGEDHREIPALTPGERRVAELAAEGASDLEIAQSLLITLPAVAGQLRAAQGKLGVQSRESLADLFAN